MGTGTGNEGEYGNVHAPGIAEMSLEKVIATDRCLGCC